MLLSSGFDTHHQKLGKKFTSEINIIYISLSAIIKIVKLHQGKKNTCTRFYYLRYHSDLRLKDVTGMALPPGFTMCVFSGLVFDAGFGRCNFVMKQPPL